MTHLRSLGGIAAFCALAIWAAGAAQAASISYFLDQSNDTTGNLPDGTNYLQVTIDNDGAPGLINFTWTILSPLTSIADSNFGLQSVGFNVVTPGPAATILVGDVVNLNAPVPPWSVAVDLDNLNQDGFGMFDVTVGDTGMARISPTLTFSVDLGGDQSSTDDILDYIAASAGNAGQGNEFFVAHVAGFFDQNPLDPVEGCQDLGEGNLTPECNVLTSAWFGGSTVVPVPAAVWLFGSALGLLGWIRRRQTS